MCFLEFLRIQQAVQELPPEQSIYLKHGAYQNDLSLPAKGVDKMEYLYKLAPKEVMDNMIDETAQEFEELGLKLDVSGLYGNSRSAHRLALHAETQGQDIAAAVKDALFRIHNIKGLSLGDTETLLKDTDSVGLKGAREILEGSQYISDIGRDMAKAEILGIESTPALVYVNANGNEKVLDQAREIKSAKGFKELIVSLWWISIWKGFFSTPYYEGINESRVEKLCWLMGENSFGIFLTFERSKMSVLPRGHGRENLAIKAYGLPLCI